MNKKYIKNGSYSVVISAVFVVIVLVVNMIVGSLPSKYTEVDVSEQKLYSIGDDTKKFLKDLDKDCLLYTSNQDGYPWKTKCRKVISSEFSGWRRPGNRYRNCRNDKRYSGGIYFSERDHASRDRYRWNP